MVPKNTRRGIKDSDRELLICIKSSQRMSLEVIKFEYRPSEGRKQVIGVQGERAFLAEGTQLQKAWESPMPE